MDLVTSAILAAIEQGARVFAREVVALSYQHLKSIIAKKISNADDILAAIAALEADPGSVPQLLAVRDRLAGANANADIDVLMAAQTLLYHIKPPQAVAVVHPSEPPPASAPPAAPAPPPPAPNMPNMPYVPYVPYSPYPPVTAAEPGGAEAPAGAGGPLNYAVMKVFFATDRNLTSEREPARKFGAQRSELSYGSCDVSIPREHRMGELESPSLWRLEFRQSPERHVVLLDAKVQDKNIFFAALSAQIQRSAKKSAFLFVHGYNVTFEDAARRTGQMAYDLGFDGASVFYSWPSQGTVTGYMVDETNIEWSAANLAGFLVDFLSTTDAQNVYLIAHSMGNRALTRAVSTVLAQQPNLAQRLAEIILTAPDIDAEVFKRDIVPALSRVRHPITLYASSEDLALAASKRVHGYPRAGDSGAGLIVMDGVETIDATGVDTSLLKHSYFAEQRSALSDMYYLIKDEARPDQRFLNPLKTAAGRYWAFKN